MIAAIIEAGIPIPPQRYHMSRWTDIIDAMKPGDSIMVENDRERHSLTDIARSRGVRLASRKINGKGIRVWRLPAVTA